MSEAYYSAIVAAQNMTRSSYVAKLRSLLAAVNAQLTKLAEDNHNNDDKDKEYAAFCWALSMRYEFFFGERDPKRLHEIVRKVMFDWPEALVSKEVFEENRERYQLGDARSMLWGIASAIELDIPDFVEAMKEEGECEAERLMERHPCFRTVDSLTVAPVTGIDPETAEKMLREMNAEIKEIAAATEKLSEQRIKALFGLRSVQRLAELRVFFDNEKAVSP